MVRVRRLLLSGMILSCFSLFAQKVKTVSAEYTFYAPETMSVTEAKRTALERAKIQAIADEFGTIVSQSTSTIVSTKNGESDSHFFAIGGSDVKGEWIETIGDPVYKIDSSDPNFLVVTCAVKGKAREIVSAGIDFIAVPLRNGTTQKFECQDFRNDDDFYLYFETPVDGFLAVYLLDESTHTVYNILPYKGQKIPAVTVDANEEYVFFSREKAKKEERRYVDEYTLTCENDKEFNTLYVLFSPNEIGKRNGFDSSMEDKPDNISLKNFMQWLSKALSKDRNLQFLEINLTISK